MVGLTVKHRQLAHQVGVFIKINLVNLMATFNFNCAEPEQGTTSIFGSWVCITDGLGGFNSHLNNLQEPKTTSAKKSNLDDLDEMLLPDLTKEIEKNSF